MGQSIYEVELPEFSEIFSIIIKKELKKQITGYCTNTNKLILRVHNHNVSVEAHKADKTRVIVTYKDEESRDLAIKILEENGIGKGWRYIREVPQPAERFKKLLEGEDFFFDWLFEDPLPKFKESMAKHGVESSLASFIIEKLKIDFAQAVPYNSKELIRFRIVQLALTGCFKHDLSLEQVRLVMDAITPEILQDLWVELNWQVCYLFEHAHYVRKLYGKPLTKREEETLEKLQNYMDKIGFYHF